VPPGVVPLAAGRAPVAEFWQRLVAYLLDSLILGAALAVPALVMFALIFLPYLTSVRPGGTPDPGRLLLLELAAFAIMVPLQLVGSYLYFVRMSYRTGQTIGKRIMKIRVVREGDGGPIDLRIARRRWVVQYAAGLVAFYFNLADGLWQLWDQPYRQSLHDKCAATVVVQVAP
jgi:uncharacterized RDD family membrane protein YckC